MTVAIFRDKMPYPSGNINLCPPFEDLFTISDWRRLTSSMFSMSLLPFFDHKRSLIYKYGLFLALRIVIFNTSDSFKPYGGNREFLLSFLSRAYCRKTQAILINGDELAARAGCSIADVTQFAHLPLEHGFD